MFLGSPYFDTYRVEIDHPEKSAPSGVDPVIYIWWWFGSSIVVSLCRLLESCLSRGSKMKLTCCRGADPYVPPPPPRLPEHPIARVYLG